jgi:hypothetical protein
MRKKGKGTWSGVATAVLAVGAKLGQYLEQHAKVTRSINKAVVATRKAREGKSQLNGARPGVAREVPERFLVALSFSGIERGFVRTIAEAVEHRLGVSNVFSTNGSSSTSLETTPI